MLLPVLILHLPLLSVAILLVSAVSSFSPSQSRHPARTTTTTSTRKGGSIILPSSFSSLAFLNNALVPDDAAPASLAAPSPPAEFVWNNTLATQQIQELEAVSAAATAAAVAESTPVLNTERVRLKRELARAAITGFEHDGALSEISPSTSPRTKTAEEIMKELERMSPLPIRSPATHHSLNAHWSFVFTGVPTVGMRLITLLSRMSQSFPFEILDFRDVALCVADDQSKAKAVVEVNVCGAWEVVLEVCTSLRRPNEEDFEHEYGQFRGEEGTLLLEHFQGVHLNGVEVPTPKSWHTTRTLEITYMDKDIMIARTSGGEPHLLLRNSPLCYSPEEMTIHNIDDHDDSMMEESIEECDINGGNKWTEFFSEAVEMYGERITRCLVDRDFGREEYEKNEITKSNGNNGNGNERQWWKSLADGVDIGQPWGVGED